VADRAGLDGVFAAIGDAMRAGKLSDADTARLRELGKETSLRLAGQK